LFDMLGVCPVDSADGDATAGRSRWADQRSSNFAACPAVPGTGAPVVSGARVLASGGGIGGERSGVVLGDGAPELSYCIGVWLCADAAPHVNARATTANIADCFLIGVSCE
jgi:hypothetical protein